VVASDAVGVELLGPVERERVKLERHPIEDGSSDLWIGLDRDQIGHLKLGGGWLGRAF
jgi:hypothetical protein